MTNHNVNKGRAVSMQLTGKQRNLLLFVALLAALSTLLVCSHIASIQNQEYIQQYSMANQMVELIRQQQYPQVIGIYKMLEPGFADSYQSILTVAYSYGQQKEYKRAEIFCGNAIKKQPSLKYDAGFLAVYGNILYMDNKLNAAQAVLERSLHCSPSKKTAAQVRAILNKIEINTKK